MPRYPSFNLRDQLPGDIQNGAAEHRNGFVLRISNMVQATFLMRMVPTSVEPKVLEFVLDWKQLGCGSSKTRRRSGAGFTVSVNLDSIEDQASSELTSKCFPSALVCATDCLLYICNQYRLVPVVRSFGRYH